MVDMNIVRELEMKGLTYGNAYKVANLMETENISKNEAERRVTREIMEKEAKAKAKAEKTTGKKK